ncbi:DNA polymerase III subunit epsilon [Bartonella sp. DGB1]|uniref:DNA polymerase III subunit epsilon n=1 Tax=Bartonella sp. DGB1 TaxID=3239807 RepID=UPI0035263E57
MLRRDIIFDTETTGLSPKEDRIIEIGAIELINFNVTGKEFHYYLNPQGVKVNINAYKVHGISDDFLLDKPKFHDIIEEFLLFIEGAHLVAHNATFDMNFLNAELQRIKRPIIDNTRVIDTLDLARKQFPNSANNLDALCKRFMINNSHRVKHGALLDSEILAEIYVELMGGKQTSFELDKGDEKSKNSFESQINNKITRQNKYLGQISVEEQQLHEEFCQKFDDNFIWNKLAKNRAVVE